VWACVLNPRLPTGCGGGEGDAGGGGGGGGGALGAACYVFDEAAGRFLYWGPNAALRLVAG
jgi:hypothetical protein